MLTILSKLVLKMFGWSVENTLTFENKYILVGAPHTSNWDFLLAILAILSLGIRFLWIGKHTLFQGVGGLFFKSIGGIPVDRSVRSSLVDYTTELFNTRENMVLCIAPEGSRSRTSYWRTGFYYIALAADVPVVLGYIDYRTKKLGIGHSFHPTGNIVADMEIIKEFYSDKIGKYTDKQGEIRIRDKKK